MSVLTTPFSGVGSTVGYKVGSSSTYTPLALLMDDCGFDGFDNGVIPLPILSSNVLTKTAGRADYGTFGGTLYLVPGDPGVQQLTTLFTNKTIASWQVQLPDGTGPTTGSAYTFSAFVNHLGLTNITGEDAPHFEFVLEISGVVTPVAGS